MSAMAETGQGSEPAFADRRRRILVLYDHQWVHVKTIAHYLESFYRYSAFAVSYASSFAACAFDLDYFDAVVLHYSVKVCYPGYLSPSFDRALRRYQGLKVLFVQDEYEATDAACRAIADLGIGIVFTCVPDEYVERVYPPDQCPGVRFVQVLTGYVPPDIDAVGPIRPIRERPLLIGYRGRDNGFWYGDLYQEKVMIGRRMKEICDARGLKTDIGWREEDRIYGDNWFRFLGSCKATLGTESGSNVFDRDGSLALQIQRELLLRPDASYEEIHAKFLRDVDGQIVMNQISPKIFEAIACRTALVLFEGRYSGVVEPDRHFIALRKDFSNVDDVLRRLQDDEALDAMTRRAYDDVIGSGRYDYRSFVQFFDSVLNRHWPADRSRPSYPWLPLPPCDALPAFRRSYGRHFQRHRLKRLWQHVPGPVRTALGAVINREHLKQMWVLSPASVRRLLQPVLQRMRLLLKRVH
jgi:hypothetical protein